MAAVHAVPKGTGADATQMTENNEMTMRILAMVASAILLALPAAAHVTVAPQQSPLGASQVYKVRVHNDDKTPTATVMLQIPAGVEISSVENVAGGTSKTTKTGGRVTAITWAIAVPVGKYVELAFTAKNPASGNSVNWNVTEKFADGSTIEYTDKPGAKEKSSVTRLLAGDGR